MTKYIVRVVGEGFVKKKKQYESFEYTDDISKAHIHHRLSMAKKSLVKWRSDYYRTDVKAKVCEVECTYNITFKCEPNSYERVQKLNKIKERING